MNLPDLAQNDSSAIPTGIIILLIQFIAVQTLTTESRLVHISQA